VGVFSTTDGSGVATFNCDSLNDGPVMRGDTATHTNRLLKRVVSLMWTPPDDFTGTIFFKYFIILDNLIV